jgi:RNA-directed DNA polymerase
MEHWQEVREQLLGGSCQPKPVPGREIPKRDGGVRELGIPCVLDWLIQQAILQVSQPRFDPQLLAAELSSLFRPLRSPRTFPR